MLKLLTNLRYGAYVTVFVSFASALLMLVAGTKKVAKTIWLYSTGKGNTIYVGGEPQLLSHLSPEDGVTARIIESLDTFLIAAVLMYFGYGIYALFCAQKDDPVIRALPASIVPNSLGELKQTLGQIILVVLMVLFTRQVWLEFNALRWEHLIVPGAVLLLGAGLRLSGVGKH